jgi:hypothetical protein
MAWAGLPISCQKAGFACSIRHGAAAHIATPSKAASTKAKKASDSAEISGFGEVRLDVIVEKMGAFDRQSCLGKYTQELIPVGSIFTSLPIIPTMRP